MKRIDCKKFAAFVLFVLAALPQGCKVKNKENIPGPAGPETVSPTVTVEPSLTPVPTPVPTLTPTPVSEPSVPSSGKNSGVKVKGIYLTSWTASSKEKMEYFIKLANETEINTFVIDVKNDDGIVSYESDVKAVKDAGTYMKKYDPEKLIKTLHDNGIYVIGRVVCFRDPACSKKYPDRAVKHVKGGLWKEDRKDAEITWLDPCDKRNWSYIIDIAKEAAEKGFDEIQFDYVRFPDGKTSEMVFSEKEFVKYEVINEFISAARKEMPDVILSADIFGIVCVSPEDTEGIGQYLELIGRELDYISPMTYPSLYARGQIVNKIEFPNPDLDPYNVVYNTLLMAKERLSKVEGYRADVRPFIQAYTASWLKPGTFQTYGAKQYREQIQAVYDAGYEQWIFWDANNKYDTSAFLKE
ncbi:MAG: putative glycoside hydrolase [Clostridiaceae bacterium]|nr:putative glycoside hydrolase [Clostridiaceae bacterium]